MPRGQLTQCEDAELRAEYAKEPGNLAGRRELPLDGQLTQCEDAELRAEYAKEPGNLAGGGELPLDGVFAELAQRRGIQHGQKAFG